MVKILQKTNGNATIQLILQAPSAFLGRFDTEDTISVCLSKVRDKYIICNANGFLGSVLV